MDTRVVNSGEKDWYALAGPVIHELKQIGKIRKFRDIRRCGGGTYN